ncbi:MAG: NUDIX hydrolase [Lysobacterales bacterium CG17_big_fil_post_rev_8_21_14_2_50_64_11]|nr:MAG: NUDIX hydrolase [Xanthomonadales bacterium CG17_big_fil_post_rev_8_21_14_2_50_64_11]PIX59979.1 MAG: NUDIX hydrolase [Xanthomonadales bacterium CG_4_10_14_3_um_filter_64_11]
MPFDLAAALQAHAVASPQCAAQVALFDSFLVSSPDVFQRWHPPGHFTGSAWLVAGDGERVLLTHHRKLGRWLQLGGHADGDCDLARVALREAQEESGLDALAVEPRIFDIDRHRIPVRADEPEHWHYDVRFVVHAGADETFVVSEESHALAWRRIDEIAADADAEASMQRMARRWLAARAAGVY